MDIRNLKYFTTAMEFLNFTHAAKECHITQTAMSQSIVKLEEELGFKLFIRNNRSVTPTKAGLDFYARALRLLMTYGEALEHGRRMARGAEGEALILAPSCIEALYIMRQLRAFLSARPAVRMSLRVVEPHLMLSMIKEGSADMAICWPHGLELSGDLLLHTIAGDEIVAVVREDSPLALPDVITAEDLSGCPVAILEANAVQNIYMLLKPDWLRDEIRPARISRLKKLEDVLLEVELNNAVAMVPSYVAANSTGRTVFKKLSIDQPAKISISVCSRADSTNPIVDELIHHFQDFSAYDKL